MKTWQLLALAAAGGYVLFKGDKPGAAAGSRSRANAVLATLDVAAGGDALTWDGSDFLINTTDQTQELAEALTAAGIHVVRIRSVQPWHTKVPSAVAVLKQAGFTVYT